MKDDPLELMEPWRLLLLVAYVVLVVPVALLAGAAWGRLKPPAACGLCGHALSGRACPSCGAG